MFVSEGILLCEQPLSLRCSLVRTLREQLLQDGPCVLALFIAFVVLYAVTLVLGLLLFLHPPGTASLQALSVSFPTAPFLSPAILAGLFGPSSLIAVAIAAIISNLFLIVPT